MSSSVRAADRIYVLQRGAIIETGTHVICSASPELFYIRNAERIDQGSGAVRWIRRLLAAAAAISAITLSVIIAEFW